MKSLNIKNIFLMCFLVCLSACGGGGGSNNAASTATSFVSSSDWDSLLWGQGRWQ